MKGALSLLLVIGLCGCLNETPGGEKTPTAESAAPQMTARQEYSSGIPLNAFLTDCSVWTTLLTGPKGTFGGPLPPGWQELEVPMATIAMELMACHRISWGAFERGPVHIIFDFTEEGRPPAQCLAGDFDRYQILRNLIVDDPEVAAWLARSYGLPAIFSPISLSNSSDLPTRWSWGEPESLLEHINPSLSDGTDSVFTHRFFWFNETELSYIDMTERGFEIDPTSPIASGALRQPMQFARTGLPLYSGLLDLTLKMDANLSLARFSNFNCENTEE